MSWNARWKLDEAPTVAAIAIAADAVRDRAVTVLVLGAVQGLDVEGGDDDDELGDDAAPADVAELTEDDRALTGDARVELRYCFAATDAPGVEQALGDDDDDQDEDEFWTDVEPPGDGWFYQVAIEVRPDEIVLESDDLDNEACWRVAVALADALAETMGGHALDDDDEAAEVAEALAARLPPVPLSALPATLPLLPLRDSFAHVGVLTPCDVARRAGAAAVRAALTSTPPLVLVACQRDPGVEHPGVGDLHPAACVARIVQAAEDASGYALVLRGEHQVRLDQVIEGAPALTARYATDGAAEPIVVSALAAGLRAAATIAIAVLEIRGPEAVAVELAALSPERLVGRVAHALAGEVSSADLAAALDAPAIDGRIRGLHAQCARIAARGRR